MDDTPPIELVSFRPGAPRAYRVAGARVVTDFDLPSLRTYGARGPATWSAEWDAPPADGGERVYGGPGLIVDRMRQVACHVSATGCRLAVEGIATYWISPDGGRITEVEVDTRCDRDTRAMAAFGAPLILALARRGAFCLHASVATFGGQLVAFIGESGAGKSTLARYLHEDGGPDWRRVIDDTLPLAPIQNDAVGSLACPVDALPHFPQLKLPDDLQPSRLVPERMPLRVVYVLETGDPIAVHATQPGAAAVALAAQTVAARLFGRDLLARHLDFCAAIARRVPVRRLVYPRHFDQLPAVRAVLATDLMG